MTHRSTVFLFALLSSLFLPSLAPIQSLSSAQAPLSSCSDSAKSGGRTRVIPENNEAACSITSLSFSTPLAGTVTATAQLMPGFYTYSFSGNSVMTSSCGGGQSVGCVFCVYTFLQLYTAGENPPYSAAGNSSGSFSAGSCNTNNTLTTLTTTCPNLTENASYRVTVYLGLPGPTGCGAYNQFGSYQSTSTTFTATPPTQE